MQKRASDDCRTGEFRIVGGKQKSNNAVCSDHSDNSHVVKRENGKKMRNKQEKKKKKKKKPQC